MFVCLFVCFGLTMTTTMIMTTDNTNHITTMYIRKIPKISTPGLNQFSVTNHFVPFLVDRLKSIWRTSGLT